MTAAPFARWMGETNDVTRTFLAAGQTPGMINLGGGLPDPATWPVAELTELGRRALAEKASDSLAYPPIEGLPQLRDAIAARFSVDGLSLARDNVLIVSGGMQGLDLVGKVLLDAGDVVASQSPAYLGALDAWRPREPVYRAMRLQDDPDLNAAMTGAQFAYTVPNFSNPTGRLVPVAQRRALIEASGATGCWLVEDDPYGTLYYDGAPLPRMLTLSGDASGSVIYMGTLSKELAPGFRVGWVIAAPKMIAALALAKQGSDMCTAGLSQVIACEALESGLVDRCLPATLDLYRARRDALLEAMDRHLSHLFRWERPEGGMFVWARARDARLDTDALLAEGLKHSVCISPSSPFDPEGRDRGAIRLNFTLNPPDRLAEGVARLAAAAEALSRRAA